MPSRPSGPMPKPALSAAVRAPMSPAAQPKDTPVTKIPMTDLPRRAGISLTVGLMVALAILTAIGFLVLYFRIDAIQTQIMTLGDKTSADLAGLSGKLDSLAQANQTRDTQMADLKTANDNLLLEIQKLEAQPVPAPPTATGTTP
ncbi:MAG TPA: hypothetical protein VN397_00270 [Candidatus Methylomirabilis sp.]|nr:hypothetical protein [Candidatus Methylomirabilis sp.]